MSLFEKTFETDKNENNSNVSEFPFRLKVGESKKIVFLSNEPPAKCYVHNVYAPGVKFDSPFDMVCYRTLSGDSCPYCKHYHQTSDIRFKSKPIYIFSVLDLTPFEIKNGDNAGKVINYSRRPMIASNYSAETIKAQLDTRLEAGDDEVRGLCFVASRSSKDKSPRIGDSFSFFNRVDLSEYGDPQPYTDEELEQFVLTDKDEILARFEKVTKGLGDSESENADVPDLSDDVIPF